MIAIHTGSILDSKADCIVNPANGHLRHDGGLARVIDQAACGPPAKNPGMDEVEWFSRERLTPAATAWQAEQRDAPLIATGNAHWTSAGVLSYKGIVHAVGPIWNGGDYCEADLLELAVESAIRIATEHDCESIALPAISCGIFGYPVEEAASIHTQVANWDLGIDIEFWPFGFEAEFQKALDRL